MRRGQIHAVDLEPVRGSEANRRRPAVIVNDDAADLAAARLGRGVITRALMFRIDEALRLHLAP